MKPGHDAQTAPEAWLWFPGVQWDGVTGTDRHLVTEIARDRLVIWVDPPLSWRDPRSRDVKRHAIGAAESGVVRVRTVGPPGISRPILRDVARRLTVRRARQAVREWGSAVDATLVGTPEQVLPRGAWTGTRLYYETDDFVAGASLLGHSVRHLARHRRRNVERSDAVLGVTPEIVLATGAGDKGHVLPNGCHPEHFAEIRQDPPLKIDLPGPVAGVVGQLNERLDVGLLEAVADAGASLLLVGPRYEQDPEVRESLDRLIRRDNVQWIDRLPYDRMPAVLAELDVGLTPYTASEFNRGSFPLKTLDYLAAGLPVVSSDLPSARALGSRDVALAQGPADFARLTTRLLATPSKSRDVARRRAFAARHSWAARARKLVQIATEARPEALTSESASPGRTHPTSSKEPGMNFHDLGDVLKRRWHVVLVALLVAACTAALLLRVVAADYSTSASLVLVPPETTLGDTGNPYLFLGGLDQTVDVLARSMNNADVRSAIEEVTPEGAGFTAVADFTTSAPIILVTTQAKTAGEANDLLEAVLDQVSRSLVQLQADLGVEPSSRIGSQVVVRADPEALQKPRIRQIALATIGVLMALLMLIAVGDSLLTRRRRTRG